MLRCRVVWLFSAVLAVGGCAADVGRGGQTPAPDSPGGEGGGGAGGRPGRVGGASGSAGMTSEPVDASVAFPGPNASADGGSTSSDKDAHVAADAGAPPSPDADPGCQLPVRRNPPASLQPQDPAFTPPRGFYEGPQELKLSTSTEGATIRYTTDGTPPTATTGTVYTVPIRITKNVAVRAQAFQNGMPVSLPVTHTYILLGTYSSAVQKVLMKLPALALAMKPADFVTVNTMGDKIIGAPANKKRYERPTSVELFYPPGHPFKGRGFMTTAGLRPVSWIAPKRPYRLTFKAEYGPGKLKYPFFESAPLHADSATAVFDRIVLRQNSNDGWAGKWGPIPQGALYLRDQFERDSQIAASGHGSRGTNVHLWVNGEYRGVYNPIERPDNDFLASYFGGVDLDYFALNDGGPIDGDKTRYDRMYQLARTGDLSKPAAYEEMKTFLDVRQFSEYLVVQFFCVNPPYDYPINRYDPARPQNFYVGMRNNPPGPAWHYSYDGEFCLSAAPNVHANFRPSASATVKSAVIMALWFGLLKNSDFKMLFADRAYAVLANDGALAPANALARLNKLGEAVREPVTVAEASRWPPKGVSWSQAFAQAQMFARTGAAALIADMRKYGYYPSIAPPKVTPYGGDFAPGKAVDVANGNGKGVVYYTLDGTDPRQSGGSPAPGVMMQMASSFTVMLSEPGTLKARVRDGTTWSALAEATFRDPATPKCVP
jgi:hypothetical protein